MTQLPSLIVPDEQTWLIWGRDLRALGWAPAPSPAGALALIAPARIPEPLAAAVRDAWDAMPAPRWHVALDGPVEGIALEELLGEPAAPGLDEPHGNEDGHHEHADGHHDGENGQGHGENGHDHGHGDHGHEDMMAIVGDPSEDGLVMESIEFVLGPLFPALPTGLVAELSLDGDVVAGCAVRAELVAPAGTSPDPLSPSAYRTAVTPEEDRPAERIVAVERERALSHSAWLWRFAELLGWEELAAHARCAATSFLDGGHEGEGSARAALLEAQRLVERRRMFRARTRGRGIVDAATVHGRGLGGPTARAAGVARDARAEDPAYVALGFVVETREAGDAEARTQVRVAEALASLRLAAAARQTDLSGPPDPPRAAVEGPRGPLPRGGAGAAEGSAAAIDLAGELATGLEWSAALVALASLDLSPWRVDS